MRPIFVSARRPEFQLQPSSEELEAMICEYTSASVQPVCVKSFSLLGNQFNDDDDDVPSTYYRLANYSHFEHWPIAAAQDKLDSY